MRVQADAYAMPEPDAHPAAPAEGVSDEALVQRLRAGEGPAGEALVRRHQQALIRYLQRLTGNDHQAEELHQQTWLSALDHLDRFDPAISGGFKAWIFRIATNKANDMWRSRARQRAAHEGLRLVREDSAPPAGERIEWGELAGKLKHAIERLPDAQRQVVMLRYYSGMKFIEIAELLGCPLNTALGRMHKAVQKLRQMMDEPIPAEAGGET